MRSRVRWSALALMLLLMSPSAGRAQYIGREPERLASLVGTAAGGADPSPPLRAGETLETARLERASALVNEGKPAAALEAIGPAGEHESLAFRYARVLLTLHADRELQFPKLRVRLAAILHADPFFRDAFDVWLGLNPSEKELRAHLLALKGRTESRASWQRADVLLRLGDAREAMHLVQTIDESDPAAARGADRVLARALFQLKDDVDGQAVYERLLDRLDQATADLLFRDVAAIASRAERQEYATLPLDKTAAFFRRFWAVRHPVPLQAQNPRLAEHYRRLARALAEYGLQSNGRGYFTDLKVFHSFSPTLPYFDSTLVFDDASASRYWLDPRGLLLLRHGDSERAFGRQSVSDTQPSESWVVGRYRSRPLLYHFVRRAPIGEWTLVLNLAVAAARQGAIADEPEMILPELSRAVLPLYESRFTLHSIYQQPLSLSDFERLLPAESEVMAGFLKAALDFDSTSYYTKENTLPLAVSLVNLYTDGQPAIEVHFEADLSDVDVRSLGEAPSLTATVVVYDREWITLEQRVEKTFPLQRPHSGELHGFVGGLLVTGLEPEDHRLTLVVSQPDSGRIGVMRGRHEVTYVPDGALGISDLVLLRQPRSDAKQEKKGVRTASTGEAVAWMPAPQRIVREAAPVQIQFELYNLHPDDAGEISYEIEERVLTLQEEPGFLGKLASYANLAGQMFFPLYTFASQAGATVISQATASETDGLTVSKRMGKEPSGPTIEERLHVDLKSLKPGVYTVYVTVRDLHTGEVISRFLTFQID